MTSSRGTAISGTNFTVKRGKTVSCGKLGEQCNDRACETGICGAPKGKVRGQSGYWSYTCIDQASFNSNCVGIGNTPAAWNCVTGPSCNSGFSTPTTSAGSCGKLGEQCNNRGCTTGICGAPKERVQGRWGYWNYKCINVSTYRSNCMEKGNTPAAWSCVTGPGC